MTIIYRETDPVSGRWTGNSSGIDLSAFQIDQNVYLLASNIATLQAGLGFTVSISYITVSGDQITFHMTDHTTQGPFTIPTATFLYRGAWTALTAYAVNDTFTEDGTLYLVIFAHTSASTFSAGANDGLGDNYYSAMLSAPGNVLPTGGAVGDYLFKTSGADFAVDWHAPPSIESASDVAFDTAGPASGEFLGFNGSKWTNAKVAISELSDVADDTPSAGNVLTWVEDTSGDSWRPVAPSGGGGGGTLASLTDTDITSPAGGDLLVFDSGEGKWLNFALLQHDLGSTSGTFPVDPNTYSVITVTPSNDIEFDNSGTGKIGQHIAIVITTTGTTSRNISFGAGTGLWVGQGTLATGTTSGKKFVIAFACGSSGTLYETSRIGPF